MFKNKSLKFRILSVFILASFSSIIVGVIGFYFANKVIQKYTSVVNDNVPNLVQFIHMNAAQVRMIIPIAQLVGSPTTAEEAAKAKDEFQQASSEFDKAAKVYEGLPFAPGEEDLWNKFKQEDFKHFKDISFQIIELSASTNKADQTNRDRIWETEYSKARIALRETFDKIIQIETADSQNKASSAALLERDKNLWTITVILIGMLVSLSAGFLIASSLSKAIKNSSDKLSEGTEKVSSASEQLLAASQQLASGASGSAASLEEGVASLEELSGMVKLNAGNAEQAADLSQRGSQQASASIKNLEELTQRMAEIQSSSKKIEEIIGVIDDIAFQTNLLALNAAVEAARAGEQGKGFAVVADAVRNLAQKSSTSAKDIADLIRQSVEQVEAGVDLAEKSNQSLKELGDAIKKVSDLNREVSTASHEQSTGVNQLSIAMNSLDKNVQSNAASSEEVAASAETLSSQAHQMADTVQELLAIVDGGKAQAKES